MQDYQRYYSKKRRRKSRKSKSRRRANTKTTKHRGNTLEWSRGSSKKKYRVRITFKNGKKKTVQFGHKDYQQYKDSMPLKLYSSKNHGDKDRRRRYKVRHCKIKRKDGRNACKVMYTPAWFSWNYLW